MSAPSSLAQQRAFAWLRWVGVGLFVAALPLPPLAVYAALTGHLSPWGILPSIGCLGLSLGAFGTANDTSLHAARAAAAEGEVPAAVAAELAHERKVRPARLQALHASPKAAVVIPLVAIGLIVFVANRLAGALAG